jgi:hypothetical protein
MPSMWREIPPRSTYIATMSKSRRDFFTVIEDARVQAIQYFGHSLPRDCQASALCHLAETLLMHAEGRAGTDYVRAWVRKIEAHLDRDDRRAAQAIITLQEPWLH